MIVIMNSFVLIINVFLFYDFATKSISNTVSYINHSTGPQHCGAFFEFSQLGFSFHNHFNFKELEKRAHKQVLNLTHYIAEHFGEIL